MPAFNEPQPFGSPTPFASVTSPTASPAITSEQLAALITPIIIQVAPVIALAVANGLIAWLSAAMPGGGVAPEIDNAQQD